MMTQSRQKSELCFALDVTSKSEAQAWVERMRKFPITLKFGLRLLPFLDADFFRQVKESGQKVFIDAKLHDIPSQVADSVSVWDALGADYLTIHLSGGAKMISGAVQAARRTQILGVSVLTSMNAADFQAESDPRDLSQIVMARSRLAIENGVQWIVSAVSDVPKIRALNPGLKSVTPGLSFDPKNTNPDQSRTASIETAISMGIEMLVVGRSILSAPKPEFVVESILDLIH